MEKIEELQDQLNQLQGGKAAAPVAVAAAAAANGKPARKRRMISAAGIARIRAAQKLRWAKAHAAKGK